MRNTMIRVDFLYRVKTKDLAKMMNKFSASTHPKFKSNPSNIKIEMAQQEEQEDTIISLNIYYHSIKDYEERTKFERSQKEWIDIWFQPEDVFIQESINIFYLN